MDVAWAASALTRLPRPVAVTACGSCGRDQPSGYAGCEACHDRLEGFWLADWAALLDEEGVAAGSADERLLAEVVSGEPERHPFTALDIAMSRQICRDCGAELGAAYAEGCWPCKEAFGNALWAERNGGVGGVEHAWHIGRWVLRHPDRHSHMAVIGWTSTMPRVMAGDLPTTAEAQRAAGAIKRELGLPGY